MVKQYLWCFAPNCKYGAANGPVKVLKSDAKKLLRWKLKSNPDCGKVCQKCYNEDLCARKAAEERLAASATRANAAALKDAGGSVQQQKPQRSREATNDSSARESVDSRPTKKSKGGNNGQDDDRMMISKTEEEEEEEQRQNEDAAGMVLPNRKEARAPRRRETRRQARRWKRLMKPLSDSAIDSHVHQSLKEAGLVPEKGQHLGAFYAKHPRKALDAHQQLKKVLAQLLRTRDDRKLIDAAEANLLQEKKPPLLRQVAVAVCKSPLGLNHISFEALTIASTNMALESRTSYRFHPLSTNKGSQWTDDNDRYMKAMAFFAERSIRKYNGSKAGG